MQTFLPYADFAQSASVLDFQRLGKQRVEAMQILNTIEGHSIGWRNHPAIRMWVGSEDALKKYFNVISAEWINRGYRHNMGFYSLSRKISYPSWLGNELFHASHRAALLYKKPAHYTQFGWTERPELNYIWP